MNDRFSAEEAALRTGAGHVADAREELGGKIDQLRSRLTSLEGQWRGTGQLAFASVMANWEADARKLTSALDVFEANLTGTDTAYTETDDAAKAALAGFNASLSGQQ